MATTHVSRQMEEPAINILWGRNETYKYVQMKIIQTLQMEMTTHKHSLHAPETIHILSCKATLIRNTSSLEVDDPCLESN